MAYFASFVVLFIIFTIVSLVFIGSAVWVYFFNAPKPLVSWFANHNLKLMGALWLLMVILGWVDTQVANLPMTHIM